MKKRLLVFGLLLALAEGHALTVGQIDVHSFLGQPLRAEVPIFSERKEEIAQLRVQLASPDDYARAGLPYSSILETLVIEPLRYPNGRWVIRIVSAEPVKSPVLDLLLHIETADGKILRHWTLLLDPPTFAEPTTKERPSHVEIALPQTDFTPPLAEATGSVAPPKPPARQETARPRHHRVRPGETLWPIAKRFKPKGATTHQMAIALFRHNPDAFVDNNLNLLRAGAVLKIPEPEAVLAMPPKEARQEFHRHMVAWQKKRRQERPPAPTQMARAEELLKPRLRLEVPREGAPTPPQEAPRALSPERQALLTLPLKREIEALRKELMEADEELALAVLEVDEQKRSKAEVAKPPAVKKPKPVVITRPKPVPQPIERPKEPSEIEKVAGEAVETVVSYRPYLFAGSVLLLILAALLTYRRYKREQEVEEIMASEEGPALSEFEGVATESVESEPIDVSVSEQETVEREEEESHVQVKQTEETISEIDWLKDFEFDQDLALDFDLTGESTAEDVVDPLTEADVYLTYFQYDKAEEIIRKALEKEPDRPDLQFKLLEIYYNKADAESFEKYAKEFAARGMAQDSVLWSRVVEMGRALCPTSDFFKETAPSVTKPEISEDETVGLTTSVPHEEGGENETISFTPPKIDFAEEGTPPSTESAPAELTATEPPSSVSSTDLELSDAGTEPPPPEEPIAWTPPASPALETKPTEEAKIALAGQRESAVKLEVAKTYLELGRQEEAKSLLEELYLHGDDEVRAEARQLLESLEEDF